MDEIKNLNLNEGTLGFWIPANLFEYNDGVAHILVNYVDKEGSIFIVKDNDNKLKFFHVIIGKGRTDTQIDVRGLSSADSHMVTAVWSLEKKEIRLFIDGNKSKSGSEIKY